MIESPPPFVPQSALFSLIKPLLEEGILQKIQDEYLYWSELKYKKTKSATLEQLWQSVKL